MEYKYFWIYFFFILSLEVLFEMVWFWEVFILKWFEFGLVCFFIWNCLILGSFYFEMVWVWFGVFFYLKWFDFRKFLFWNGLSLVWIVFLFEMVWFWEVFILKWLFRRPLSVCGENDFISLCVWHLAVCWIDGFLFWNENWELKALKYLFGCLSSAVILFFSF